MRAIAYAGALQLLPPDLRIHIVAGASAGALIAALIAIGKRPDDLKAILETISFGDFLDEDEKNRLIAIQAMLDDISNRVAKKKSLSAFQLWRLWTRHKDVVEDLPDIWKKRGLHSSRKLRSWLDGLFGDLRFGDISAVHDLRIISADVTRQRYHIYSKQNEPRTLIAEAVHSSISIPVFFEPLNIDTTCFVDGGLLSNFPSFLFAQGVYPTIGFRLSAISRPLTIESTTDYVKGLILTMTDAHDKERGIPSYFHEYEIDIPDSIPSTKFILDQAEIDLLYQNGLKLSRTVNWKHHSSPKPIVPYYDPKPQECLQLTLKEANKLYVKFGNHENWCDGAHIKIRFSVIIDNDWTGLYQRDTEINILEGDTQLFFKRIRFSPTKGSSPPSLIDFRVRAEEIHQDGKREPLIKIPCTNDEQQKGFLAFYTPPVSRGKKRRFIEEITVPHEFEGSLGIGREDKVSFSIHQFAKSQSANIEFNLLFHESLGEITIDTDFGHEFQFSGIEEHDVSRLGPDSKRPLQKFRAYKCETGQIAINGTPAFAARLSFSDELSQMPLFG